MRIAKLLDEKAVETSKMYNINFPVVVSEYDLIKSVPLAQIDYKDPFEKKTVNNKLYYNFSGKRYCKTEGNEHDYSYLEKGIATITPISLNFTDYETLNGEG